MSVTSDALPGFFIEFFDISANKEIVSIAEVDFDASPAHEDVVDRLAYSGEAAWWEGGRGNFFAVRATADVVVDTAGEYTFRLRSDSGAQLRIADTLLIENATTSGTETGTVTLWLEAGLVPLEVLYFETRGDQVLNLRWSGPDTGGDMVLLRDVVIPGDDTTDPEPEPGPEEPVLPRPPEDGPGEGPDRVEAVDFTPGQAVAVSGGRTTTLELDTTRTIASMEITEGPAAGHVTVNPDNSFALVLSGTDHEGALSFDYKVTYGDGSTGRGTAVLDVQPIKQQAGWATGEHYMLETDARGDVVVETGDNHRKVYISGSAEALTLREIAAREGIPVAEIDARWLVAHPEYGGSENMALAPQAGMQLWYELTIGKEATPGSHWLLFESGHTYSDLGKIVGAGASGESELHPLHVTSWGDGPLPVIDNGFAISQKPSEHVVISNLHVTGGVNVKESSNILVTDVDLTDKGMGVRNSEKITLHDSTISYVTVDSPDGSGVTQGLLVVATDGILLDGNVIHHNGWLDGYNMDGTNHAPDGFSHNVYLQWNTTGVTFRDNITSQSSSVGAQLRGGAFAEGNFFVDNNVAGNFLGGNYKDFDHVGNFTYFADNVITSGAYKEAQGIGAKGWGATNGGYETALVDNIVAHLANPDDPGDIADKERSYFAIGQRQDASIFYDDTKVLNWQGSDPVRFKEASADRNLAGTDVLEAMATTIHRYTAELTSGKTATIDGLMDYILSLSGTEFDDLVSAREIVDYFRAGFGMDVRGTAATEHRFIPNDLGDGLRWDNRINWSSGELPDMGDTVDLGGNRVHYGTLTTRIDDLDLGTGGTLSVTSGKLQVTENLYAGGGGAFVSVDGSGQFWTSGLKDGSALNISVDGGRFANTGILFGDVNMRVTDNAQAILAKDWASTVLSANSELRIEGSRAKVGFDGDSDGAALFKMASGATLSFVADADGFSTLREFRSGAWDQAGSPVSSGVSLDGLLQIDLSAYEGGPGTHELIRVDALQGLFEEVHILGLKAGLQARTVLDFDLDTVTLRIFEGTGPHSVAIRGNPDSGADEDGRLWNTLITGHGSFDATAPVLFDSAATLQEDDFFFL